MSFDSSTGPPNTPSPRRFIQDGQQLRQHLPQGWPLLGMRNSSKGTGRKAGRDLLRGAGYVHQQQLNRKGRGDGGQGGKGHGVGAWASSVPRGQAHGVRGQIRGPAAFSGLEGCSLLPRRNQGRANWFPLHVFMEIGGAPITINPEDLERIQMADPRKESSSMPIGNRPWQQTRGENLTPIRTKTEISNQEALSNRLTLSKNFLKADPEFRVDCYEAISEWIPRQRCIWGCQYSLYEDGILEMLCNAESCNIIVNYEDWMNGELNNEWEQERFERISYFYPRIKNNTHLEIYHLSDGTSGFPLIEFLESIPPAFDLPCGIQLYKGEPSGQRRYRSDMHQKYMIGLSYDDEMSIVFGSFNLTRKAPSNIESILLIKANMELTCNILLDFSFLLASSAVSNYLTDEEKPTLVVTSPDTSKVRRRVLDLATVSGLNLQVTSEPTGDGQQQAF